MFKYASLLALASLAFAQDNSTQPQSLNATLASNPDLSNLTTLLATNPQLLTQLSNAQNITILAPNNAAITELLNSTAGGALATNPDAVTALLQYHILNGTYTASQISNMSAFVPTMLMNQDYTNVTGGQVVEAIKIGEDVVFYSGLLQNATVAKADVNFTGGVIHIVDSVLTIPEAVTDTALAANLTSLFGAVNATGLVDTVNYTPNITIFAPINEAFQNIGSALANLSTEDLGNILAYHVVNGTVGYSSGLENGTTLTAANGGELKITIENGTVFVNAAEVVVPNVLVANGVVHVIDNVLNPSNTEGPAENATSNTPAFSATPVSDVPFTSGVPSPTTQINPTSEGAGPAETAASSSSTGAAMPMRTGAVGVGALLGAGAAVFFV